MDELKRMAGVSNSSSSAGYQSNTPSGGGLSDLKRLATTPNTARSSYSVLPKASEIQTGTKQTADNYKISDRTSKIYSTSGLRTEQEYDKLIKDAKSRLEALKKSNSEKGLSFRDLEGTADYKKQKDLENEIENYETELYALKNGERFNKIPQNADFAKKSKSIDESLGRGIGIGFGDKSIGSRDNVYSYIFDLNGERTKPISPDRASVPLQKYDYMTDEEKGIYNYLYQTEGKKEANDYLEYISYALNDRKMGQYATEMEKIASDQPFWSSAYSVGTNLTSGAGILDIAWQNAARDITGEYKPIDYNSALMQPSAATTTIRGTVSNNIADATGRINLDAEKHPVLASVFNGKSLGDVYQLGMSMADSLAIAYGVGPGGTFLLGGSAGTQGVLDAINKGATDSQALSMGILNGTFETLFEYVSLDKLVNGDAKNLVEALFVQGGIEGSEEFFTSLANTVADICIMAEKSDYQKKVQEYISQGYSKEEAERMTLEDIALNMGVDFIGGAITGGIMGSNQYAINKYINEPAYYKGIYGGNIENVISEASNVIPEDRTLQRAKSRIDKGKNVSGRDIRSIVTQYDNAVLDKDKGTIKEAAAKQLIEYGETTNVNILAAAIAKQAAGENLTKSEREIISSSKYGQRVANELDPQNIEAGGYNTAWAENIGTKKINAESYNRILQEAFDGEKESSEQAAEQRTSEEAAENVNNQPAYANAAEAEITAPANKTTKPASKTTVSKQQKAPYSLTKEQKALDEEIGSTTTLDEAAKEYGAQAEYFKKYYKEGQDVDRYAAAYKYAWDIGRGGGRYEYVSNSAAGYLTEAQRRNAYEAGQSARRQYISERSEYIKKNGTAGKKYKGVVTFADGVNVSSLNPTQKTAYRIMTRIAEATGIDIVLETSEADSEGNFPAKQGSYSFSKDPGTIHVNINAGLRNVNGVSDLSNYTMLRTFSHEFTHFVENWNAAEYENLKEAVFDAMEANGVDVGTLIDEKMAFYKENGIDISYDGAVREVVAEGMTDVLPESSFIQTIATEHKSLFDKLHDKLKEFLDDLKAYFKSIKPGTREAQALKQEIDGSIKYVQSVVDAFDAAAKGAVENYQGANGEVLIDQPAKPDNLPKHENQKETKEERRERLQKILIDKEKLLFDQLPEESKNILRERYKKYKDIFEKINVGDRLFDTAVEDYTYEVATVYSDGSFMLIPIGEGGTPHIILSDSFTQGDPTFFILEDGGYFTDPSKKYIGRDYFPANDFTSQAEEGPDLKSMVPKAAQKPADTQEEDVTSVEASSEQNTPTAEVETQTVEQNTPTAETEAPIVAEEAAEETTVNPETATEKQEKEPAKQEVEEQEKRKSPSNTDLQTAVSNIVNSEHLNYYDKMETLLFELGIYSKGSDKYEIIKQGIFSVIRRSGNRSKAIPKSVKNAGKADAATGKPSAANSIPAAVKRVISKAKTTALSTVDYYGENMAFYTDGKLGITVSEELYSSMKNNGTGEANYLSKSLKEILDAFYNSGEQIKNNPVFRKSGSMITVIFEQNGNYYCFDKKLVDAIDAGGAFYLADYGKGYKLLVSTDKSGNFYGFSLPVRLTGELKTLPAEFEIMQEYDKMAEEEGYGEKQSKKEPAKQEDAAKPKTVEKKTEQKKPAEKTKANEAKEDITDFGEKIGGARKDMWAARGLDLSDIENMTEGEKGKFITKDNVYPKPDYSALVENGMDKEVAFFIKQARDALAASPKFGRMETAELMQETRKQYIEFVKLVKDTLDAVKTKADAINAFDKIFVENGYFKHGIGYESGWTAKGQKNNVITNKLVGALHVTEKNWSRSVIAPMNKAQFLVDSSEKLPAGTAVRFYDGNGYSRNNDWQPNTYYIVKGHSIVQTNFESKEAAIKWAQENLAKAGSSKKRFVPPHLEKVHRTGRNYRQNNTQNMTGDDYMNTFRFRGGEFGNWVNQDERQASLNYGYDALMDLADALGISPSSISLGGKLAIAFGARGHGDALAHFEPEREVINLTKMKGAGSLSHEWAHALDFIVGKALGANTNMTGEYTRLNLPEMKKLVDDMRYRDMSEEEISEKTAAAAKRYWDNVDYAIDNQLKTTNKKRADVDEKAAEFKSRARSIKPEDRAAINKLLNDMSDYQKEVTGHVIQKEALEQLSARIYLAATPVTSSYGRTTSEFYRMSKLMDGDYTKQDKGYWSSDVEMFARAFACYITDKLSAENLRSDYLSGHSESAVSISDNGEIIYAYPRGAERETLNADFDALIQALKDKGVLEAAESRKRTFTSDAFSEDDITQYQLLEDDTQYQVRSDLSEEAYQFSSDIDRWNANGRPNGETFILGSTGDVFQGLGAIESDIYLLSDKVNQILREHPEMTIKEIKNIPEILENPVLVLASRNTKNVSNNTRLVVFGMVKAQNHIPVMTVFDLHPIENNLYVSDMQKVTSAYTKNNSPDSTKRLIENSYVLYSDKNKATSLLHTAGFQNAYRIEQSGYVGMITYQSDKVNIIGKPFNDVFSKTTTDDDEQYQIRDNRLSDREVLEIAASKIDTETMSAAEVDALNIFQKRLDKLRELEEQRRELGTQYKEQQFGVDGNREEAKTTLERMRTLDKQIEEQSASVLKAENSNVLKKVLQQARKDIETAERERGAQVLKEYRARRNEAADVKKYRKRIENNVATLRKWLVNPSNKDMRAHVPAEIQKTVANFLESINLMSKTALRTSGLDTTKADEKYLKNMKKMRDAIKANVNSQGLYSGYADLPEDFIENFEALISKTEEHIDANSGQFVVNKMSAAELKQLSETLKTLKKYITTMNAFHNNAMFQHTYEAGEETIEHLSKFSKSKNSGLAYKFMRFDYMRPSYAFEHFGKGGQSIEHEFREGQATQAFLANKIIDFAKKTYTGKEVKAWSEKTKTFELSDGETVTMPITHLMSLYCLNKRPQALTHIYGDGIRVANYKNGKNVELDEGHLVTLKDVQKMIKELTPRQMEVADALQKYMSTETAAWGNYVSMARFDVEQFTEENYFPINSDGRYLSTTADESPDNAGLYALLNSSFTKELKENAKNRIILYNIFDVFANHTASVAQYRAFALPVLDALKWFNYKNDDTSVRTKLSSAFGAPLDERAGSGAKGYAEQFVINLLKAYNGTSAQGDPYDSLPLKILHHYNGAAIAYNLRVVIQQPTAITRAAMVLSPAKLTKGLGMSTMHLKKLADEMEAHSGIAAWKALGFYDTNISRGLTDLIKQNPGVLDKVMDVGTKGAEMADRFTWAAMWYAAKDTVRRSDYKSDEEYFKAVTDLFEDVIYKTQVVDSLLTKAEFLRSKGGIARQMGSFMSEPSATMSMLADAHFKFTDDMQQGMSRSEAWQRNGGNIAKTAAVYAIGQVILSAMQAVIDAWRDQDDEDPENWLNNYLQKYLKAFKGNVVDEEMIFGKIPLISELYELMKGYLDKFGVFDKLNIDMYGNDISSGLSMYTKYLSKAVDIIADKALGNKTNYTNYGIVYNLIRAVSNLSGVPFATAWREVQDVWNNTVGYFVPSKKLVTYQRAVDKVYNEQIQQTGLGKSVYQNILDDADKVHGDGNGSLKQDELGAALMAAIEDGKATEEQAEAIWNTNGWSKTFSDWRGKVSTSGTSAKGYDDFKKVPVNGKQAKQAMYGVWENQLQQSGMSLERFIDILNNADTDGNDSIKQDEMGIALMTSMQSGELTFEQCDAIWRAQWNNAKSKTFAKWMNG